MDNPLAKMGSNVFIRRYKGKDGVWREERQVNLGGEQGTVTYVHENDYERLLDFMRNRCVGVDASADAARWELIGRVADEPEGGL